MLHRFCKHRFILVIAAWVVTPLAWAQMLYQFDLPAQPLADSLRAIAAKSGTNILFDPRDVKGLKAAALHEQLAVNDAINRVLVGTQLETESTAPATIIIRPIINGRAAIKPDRLR